VTETTWLTCEGQAQYTEAVAHEAAVEMNERGAPKVVAYECIMGPHWHVGPLGSFD
jgi:hypothetical protein